VWPVGGRPGEIVVCRGGQSGLVRAPTRGVFQDPDFRVGVQVFLREGDTGTHVEKVPDTRTFVPESDDFPDMVGDQAVKVENSAIGEDTGNNAHEGLGDGHQQVPGIPSHRVRVTLVHDHAVVQHQKGVGVRLPKDIGHTAGVPGNPGNRDLENGPLPHGERCDGSAAAADRRGRHDPVDVQERPAVERRLLPVGQGGRPARVKHRRSFPADGGPTGCRRLPSVRSVSVGADRSLRERKPTSAGSSRRHAAPARRKRSAPGRSDPRPANENGSPEAWR